MQASVGEFLKPRVVKVTPTNAKQAKVVIEPFERGFGHTLGNALRRVLLSSMPGAPLPGGVDGCCTSTRASRRAERVVVDILLNLKRSRSSERARRDAAASPKKGRSGHRRRVQPYDVKC
jgi:DNA-directed RNA polymerase subunit alpha